MCAQHFIAGRLMMNTIRMPNQIVCRIVKCGINKEFIIKYFNWHGSEEEEEEDFVCEDRVINKNGIRAI